MDKPTKCVPCSSSLPPLEKEKCEEYLADLPGWELLDDACAIARKYTFKNFVQAMEFAEKVGHLAEEMGHHPVLTVGWGFCQVRFKTSKINGLHANDFVMAGLVDKLPG
ncbi:MAG: pterin-4-alpha-carbinolamine dehydratase [Candidatus Riflebacteria bacterium HGW-Riflebacteria-2]|nr:MAG: pterin-4-alpha-carbinolamine dehydratase [Candidatus Riflebacteria bacterium HGW-Riflebacteria-2]